MLDAAIAAIRAGHNQYPPGIGIPELRHAIAAHQAQVVRRSSTTPTPRCWSPRARPRPSPPSLLALCEPGDEVVTFEPYYDSYAACIALAGAHATRRAAAHARLVVRRRRARARDHAAHALLLLNSPHNPTGKVFSVDELELIARLCVEHDLVADHRRGLRAPRVRRPSTCRWRRCPGMRDRTVTISSGGKTFSCTGWKIGWVCAPPDLVDAVRTVKQFLTYVNGGPFQYGDRRRARPAGLDVPRASPPTLRGEARPACRRARRRRASPCFPSAGTYFVTADIRSLGETDGLAFCRALPERCGVVAVPSVVFYDDKDAGSPLVRFACCKRLDVIDEAVGPTARSCAR